MQILRSILPLIALVLMAAGAMAQQRFMGTILQPTPAEQETLEKIFKKQMLINLPSEAIYNYIKSTGSENSNPIIQVGNFYTWDIDLQLHEMRSPDYISQRTTSTGTITLPRTECITYAGYMRLSAADDVRLNIEANKVWGYITDKGKKYYLEQLNHFIPSADPQKLVLYNPEDVLPKNARCDGGTISEKVDEKAETISPDNGKTQAADCRKIEIATESDLPNFQQGTTASDIVGNLNLVEPIYQNSFGSSFIVKYQHEWSTTDPYTSAELCVANDLLSQFRAYWQTNFTNIKRDINIMYSARTVSGSSIVIGCAYTFTFQNSTGDACYTVCRTFYFGSQNTANQRQCLVAHEVGHIFSGVHDASGCSSNAGPIMCPSLNDVQGYSSGTPYWSALSLTAIEGSMASVNGSSRLRKREFNTSGSVFFPFVTTGNQLFFSAPYSTIPPIFPFSSSSITLTGTDEVTLQPGFSAVINGGGSITVTTGACDINGNKQGQNALSKSEVPNQLVTINSAKISPNPFTNSFTIKLKLEQVSRVSVSLYDMLGKQIAAIVNNQQYVKGAVQLQYTNSKLAAGTYLCVVEVNGKRFTEKVVKME